MTTRAPSTIRRDLEFFSDAELTKQLGYRRGMWPMVILAELIDNALDHLEEVGRLPDIEVTITEDSLAVKDNGNGIPEEVIDGLLDFATRTSSRIGYKTPTRGAQGNAGKCLVAVPFVWGGGGYVEIASLGVNHVIRTYVDDVDRCPVVDRQKVQIDQNQESHSASLIGTEVTVHLPKNGLSFEAVRLMLINYFAANPHASFTLTTPSESASFPRTTQKINKWTAAKPDPVDWYSQSEFRERILSVVAVDRANGKYRSVANFVREFAGFARSDARSELLQTIGLHRSTVSDLVDKSTSEKLHRQMLSMTPRTLPKMLGRLGRQHVQDCLSLFDGSGCRYKCIEGFTKANIPFVLEVGFADAINAVSERVVLTSVNGSADVGNPSIQAIPSLIEENRLHDYFSAVVIVSLRLPAASYTNRGKTELVVDQNVMSALRDALAHALKDHLRWYKANERDERRAELLKTKKTRTGDSMKSAIWDLLPESIDALSMNGEVRFDARSHYYWMREHTQAIVPGRILIQGYLDKVIDQWEQENGVIEMRERDARGFLYQPHTGQTVPLGTREVAEFQMPENLFHNLLYIEKKGLLSILKHNQIAEKYDIGIVAAEGYSTRASQALMQQASKQKGMKVIVIHDADPWGYSIADALGRNSGAHEFSYEVIDAGLTIAEAVKMGLPTETFERPSALQKNIDWTAEELEYFTGREVGYSKRNGTQAKKWVECRRVELNAISADPERFVSWVESKLKLHGCDKKLIPNKDTVIEQAIEDFKRRLSIKVRDRIESLLKIDDLVDSAISEIKLPSFTKVPAVLKKWSKSPQPEAWRSVVEIAVARQIRGMATDISKAVESAIDGRS
jgi:Histidine kinase-, DNA gyrase B-, and HSP90-like ATPase